MKTQLTLALIALLTVSAAEAASPKGNRPNSSAKPRAQKPNVILVITDDQGYGDLSANGNPVLKTPAIDRLAAKSVRLEDYHVSPYCVPSRASLMTGRYADRTGVHNHMEPHWFVRSDEVMLSNLFRDAGYATGMFGKWHLGDNYPYRPMDRGFDEVLRHGSGAIGTLADYWDNCYLDDTYIRNGKPTKVEGYCTDVFFNAAKRFIKTCAGQKKPFMLYLATNAPHGPLVCPPEYTQPYRKGKGKRVANFFGMIANIDGNVGQLRNFLKNNGLTDNTIFIFTTDNGSAWGARIFNAGMRGHKGDAYDGGHRVPFYLHWPAGGFNRERKIETLTSHIDITPTLLDLCGISKPVGVEFDGVSLLPLLKKGDHATWPDRMIMTDAQRKTTPPRKWSDTVVMTEKWRLVNGSALYDIDADPGQKQDVRAQHPETFKRLNDYYDQLWEDLQPSFLNVAEIPLSVPGEDVVALNYMDCMRRHFGWFQDDIRQIAKWIDDPQSTRELAFWPVNVVEEGEYRIEMRRWPVEADHAIHDDMDAGAKVYGQVAHRTRPGMGFPAVKAELTIGDQHVAIPVNTKTKGAIARMTLPMGSQRLSAKFFDAKGRSLDVFYVYASKEKR